MALQELDTVELTAEHDGVPAGTTGAVVAAERDRVLVEVVRPDGTTSGLLELKPDQVRLVRAAA